MYPAFAAFLEVQLYTSAPCMYTLWYCIQPHVELVCHQISRRHASQVVSYPDPNVPNDDYRLHTVSDGTRLHPRARLFTAKTHKDKPEGTETSEDATNKHKDNENARYQA